MRSAKCRPNSGHNYDSGIAGNVDGNATRHQHGVGVPIRGG
jgi:hypothetical protein